MLPNYFGVVKQDRQRQVQNAYLAPKQSLSNTNTPLGNSGTELSNCNEGDSEGRRQGKRSESCLKDVSTLQCCVAARES